MDSGLFGLLELVTGSLDRELLDSCLKCSSMSSYVNIHGV